jgi:phosphatidylinositol alpha-1,6-mannosyltransferase
MPIRVLLLAGEYPPIVGGVGTFAANSARALRILGARVRTVTSVPTAEKREDDDVLRVLPTLNRKFLKMVPLMAGGVLSAVRDRPDVVLAAAWPHEGITAYSLRKALGIPYAVMVHGTEVAGAQTSPARVRAFTRVVSSAALLVANSHFTKGLLLEKGVRAPVAVVHPPIDLEALGAAGDAARVDARYALHGKRVLLTTARLFPRKGHAQVIRALGRLGSRYSDVVYVATGAGSYRSTLEEIAASAGVADRVRFTGFVDSQELQNLYRRCDIYVSPGIDDAGDIEGFGISFVEASAHGKPIIAGRIGGVGDAVARGETGLLIDGTSQHELDEALVRLLDDRLLRSRLGENGRTKAQKSFGLEHQGRRLLDALEGVVRADRCKTSHAGLG